MPFHRWTTLRTLSPWITLASLTLTASVVACQQANAEDPPPPRPVAWATVEATDGGETRLLHGVVRARRRARLSFEVGGRVADVRVDVGDRFARGDVLATLERRTHQLVATRRRAELLDAKAARNLAELDFQRQDELLGRNATTLAAHDAARARLESAESRVEVARASLSIANEDLRDTKLRAPYDGRVAERLVEPSQAVAQGRPVLRIQGEGGYEAVIDVPERLVSRLEVGATHDVDVPALGLRGIRGVVSEVGADATRGGVYPIHLSLEGPPERLRAGASAEVRLTLRGEGGPAVIIPISAFAPTSDGRADVFVIEDADDGATEGPATVSRRQIRIGEVGDEQARVTGGLQAGEDIVTKGIAFLREGQRVRRLGDGPDRYGR